MFWKRQHKRDTQKIEKITVGTWWKSHSGAGFEMDSKKKTIPIYSYDIFDLYLLIGSTLLVYRYVCVCVEGDEHIQINSKWEILNHPGFLSETLPLGSQKLCVETIPSQYFNIKKL
jgi:hypothetical protein